MSHDGPQLPDDHALAASSGSHSVRIRDARAQVETARLRQRRTAPGAGVPEGALPGYTLVRELHRGGQGVVYLAVQRSTERKVAIKVLNRGPVAASATALARFEREVGALSLLKHPNIVTIHDCGRDREHVYLVMDYVDGRPLDVYVDRERTPVADTLRLFAKICDGVNAAHLRGVIHRDLKPGNILVDERAEPHVLDFGLAKLADESPDATELPEMTATGQFVGSLPWASPEQAEGRSDELDIRTDVYSLGVVLYQLLTGRFPYPVSGRLTDVVRHIVHTDPARPTTVDRRVDRELETILLKCLAKEPDRRYQSAGDLARDLRRYLAGQPIEARRDSLAYVMAKRLARYRAAAIAGAAVFAVVLAALVVSVSLWGRAERQRTIALRNAAAAQEAAQRADREARQVRAVVDFMREVLTSAEPESRGPDVRLVEVLAAAAATASTRLAAHPLQEAEVRELLAQVYYKLSMWADARTQFERAAELWAAGAGPGDVRTLGARLGLARTLLNLSEPRRAEEILGDLPAQLERALGPDDPQTLDARRCEALTHLLRGRADEAERRLLELRARLANDDGWQIQVLTALATVHTSRLNTGDEALQQRTLEAMEPLASEWIERSTRLLGPEATPTLHATVKWAEIAAQRGRFEEAASACRRVLDAGRLGECHTIRSNAMYILAEASAHLGDDQGAAHLFVRVIECTRRQYGPDNLVLLGTITDALKYLDRAGSAVEGEKLAREAVEGLRRFGGGHGDVGVMAEMYVAAFVSTQNRLGEADGLFRPLLERADEMSDRRARARLRTLYAIHLTRGGRFDDAERELAKAVGDLDDIRQGTWDSHPDDVIRAHVALYEAWGKPERVAEYRRLGIESVRR